MSVAKAVALLSAAVLFLSYLFAPWISVGTLGGVAGITPTLRLTNPSNESFRPDALVMWLVPIGTLVTFSLLWLEKRGAFWTGLLILIPLIWFFIYTVQTLANPLIGSGLSFIGWGYYVSLACGLVMILALGVYFAWGRREN